MENILKSKQMLINISINIFLSWLIHGKHTKINTDVDSQYTHISFRHFIEHVACVYHCSQQSIRISTNNAPTNDSNLKKLSKDSIHAINHQVINNNKQSSTIKQPSTITYTIIHNKHQFGFQPTRIKLQLKFKFILN